MKLLVLEAIGLHTGFLGCYGNEWVATPALDSLACEGVVFDNHLADHPVLSNASISGARSGRYGFKVGHDAAVDALSVFRDRGWQAECVAPSSLEGFAAPILDAVDGWTEGRPALIWVDGPSLAPPWKLRRRVLGAYFDEEVESRPWPDPRPGMHGHLPLEDWDRLRDTYAAVVSYFDARLEEVCNGLVERGWAEEVAICVTARSGLALAEHGYVGEGTGPLHAERVHVPLVLRLPGEAHGGMRVRALTQSVDLLPSLAELFLKERVECDGVSFGPLLRREAEKVRTFGAAVDGDQGYLRVGEWALSVSAGGEMEPGVSRLFLKPEDRWEVNDLRLKEFERAEEMERQLKKLME